MFNVLTTRVLKMELKNREGFSDYESADLQIKYVLTIFGKQYSSIYLICNNI